MHYKEQCVFICANMRHDCSGTLKEVKSKEEKAFRKGFPEAEVLELSFRCQVCVASLVDLKVSCENVGQL